MPNLRTFVLEIENAFAIFETSALEFVSFQSLNWLIKIFKFRTKNALFRYFWNSIWKQHCHIWKYHSRIRLAAKFQEKKMSKFGPLFGYFSARVSKNWDQKCVTWVFFDYKFQNVLSYLISAPSNLSNCKILQKKQKCLNLGPKWPYSGIFIIEFWTTIVILEISTLKFI